MVRSRFWRAKQVWHAHLARDSRAGRPCHQHAGGVRTKIWRSSKVEVRIFETKSTKKGE